MCSAEYRIRGMCKEYLGCEYTFLPGDGRYGTGTGENPITKARQVSRISRSGRRLVFGEVSRRDGG